MYACLFMDCFSIARQAWGLLHPCACNKHCTSFIALAAPVSGFAALFWFVFNANVGILNELALHSCQALAWQAVSVLWHPLGAALPYSCLFVCSWGCWELLGWVEVYALQAAERIQSRLEVWVCWPKGRASHCLLLSGVRSPVLAGRFLLPVVLACSARCISLPTTQPCASGYQATCAALNMRHVQNSTVGTTILHPPRLPKTLWIEVLSGSEQGGVTALVGLFCVVVAVWARRAAWCAECAGSTVCACHAMPVAASGSGHPGWCCLWAGLKEVGRWAPVALRVGVQKLRVSQSCFV